MKNIFNSQLKLMTLSLVVLLTGCKEIAIKNGEVPTEYLAQAQLIEGTYSGTFEGKKGQIKISFNGNKPQLSYSNNTDNEFLSGMYSDHCGATFGLLKTVVVSKNNNRYNLKQANFGFNPGNCKDVRGRVISLQFKNSKQFRVSIHYNTKMENKCKEDLSPPFGPGRHCEIVQTPTYLEGSFKK